MFTRMIPDAAHVRFPRREGLVASLPLLLSMGITGPAFADRDGPATPPPAANPAATAATSMDAGGGPPDRPPAQPPAEQARVPEVLPAAPAALAAPAAPPPVAPDGSPPAQALRGVGAGAGVDAPVVDTTAGERVVVCKYVRKPFVAEVAHHVVIVNEEALVGRGFRGSFPWAFSDGQFRSVAIRFAADGEQAREVTLASCPRQTGGTEPGGTEPGTSPEVTTVPGEVTITPRLELEPRSPAASPPAGVLPQTGAPSGIEAVLLLSSASLLGGLALWLRGHAPVRRPIGGSRFRLP